LQNQGSNQKASAKYHQEAAAAARNPRLKEHHKKEAAEQLKIYKEKKRGIPTPGTKAMSELQKQHAQASRPGFGFTGRTV
jgi:cytochrome c553